MLSIFCIAGNCSTGISLSARLPSHPALVITAFFQENSSNASGAHQALTVQRRKSYFQEIRRTIARSRSLPRSGLDRGMHVPSNAGQCAFEEVIWRLSPETGFFAKL